MPPSDAPPSVMPNWSHQLALARQLSALEYNHRQLQQYIIRACSTPGRGRIGVTGSPGVGKSTFITQWLRRLYSAGCKTAVLAIDPSSSVSGGAVLGDRYRFGNAIWDLVFVRS